VSVLCVVGARPNFMKMAPVVRALLRGAISCRLLHTGQHYDPGMSRVFFGQLGLPEPDTCLGVGSDSHVRQTARIMTGVEEALADLRPSLVVVGGDVNSTVATAFAAAKTGVPVAHVEAGLRSFDRQMPEEVNRVVTDHLSSLLFTTEEAANENLAREGIDTGRVHFVGNCMVDTLLEHVTSALEARPWERFGLGHGDFALVTLHRPSNVDEDGTLTDIMSTLAEVARSVPVLFPVHPRTAARLNGLRGSAAEALIICEPLPYLDFLGLMAGARMVLTDSGGIQEETTVLGVPCLTLRWNTERPVTTSMGTNRLVGTDAAKILAAVGEILGGAWSAGSRPPLWDGHAGDRIASIIAEGGWR
jgi:UDP-N-acetylglucosamine 2-epimerase (non-hydrolysing)